MPVMISSFPHSMATPEQVRAQHPSWQIASKQMPSTHHSNPEQTSIIVPTEQAGTMAKGHIEHEGYLTWPELA